MIKKKKIITAMVIGLAFTSVTPYIQNVKAQEVSDLASQNGITFITVTDSKYEYLYEREGMTYKNIEYIDGNHINTFIYEYDSETDSYIEVDSIETIVSAEEIIIKQSGETTVTENPFSSQIIEPQLLNDQIISYGADEGNGDWTYKDTDYGSTKWSQFTIAAIAATIALISKVPASAKWVATMAGLYYSFGKDIAYTRYEYYTRGSGISTETKVVINYYSDSNRTNNLGANAYISSRSGISHLWSYTN